MPHRLAERVPLTRRRDKLYLGGVRGSVPIADLDLFGFLQPAEAWFDALLTAMPRLAREQAHWCDPKWAKARFRHGYRGYWARPLSTLHIHRCADCETAWYVAHFSVKRCEACEHERRQSQVRASNALMVARRADKRAAGRTAMTCDTCSQPMTGRRLRRYCSAACRQAAYRERAP